MTQESFKVHHRYNGIGIQDRRRGRETRFPELWLSVPQAEELVAKLTALLVECLGLKEQSVLLHITEAGRSVGESKEKP